MSVFDGFATMAGGNWRRGPESNRRIKVFQTSPLPLGYRALLPKLALCGTKVYSPESQNTRGGNKKPALAQASAQLNLERETGFEPPTSTLARSHSTTELLPLVTASPLPDPSTSLGDFGARLGRCANASSYSRSAVSIINKPQPHSNGRRVS